jgi:hypothetical protein
VKPVLDQQDPSPQPEVQIEKQELTSPNPPLMMCLKWKVGAETATTFHGKGRGKTAAAPWALKKPK